MQTQCPHCDTRFRVTESQVSLADGYVRCGVCKEVFNAYEVANKARLEDEKQPSLLDATDIADTRTEEARAEDARTEAASTDEAVTSVTGNTGIEHAYGDAASDAETTDDAPSEEADTQQQQEASLFNPYRDDLSEDIAKDATEDVTEELEAEEAASEHRHESEVDFNDTDATDPTRKDAFDFFDEKSNHPLEHVVPDKLRESHDASSSPVISTLLWSIAVLLMTTTLIVQYVWFNRDQYSEIPEIQALTKELCQYIECETVAMRAPSRIELISRNVYSHPNEKDALMVNITMKNTAEFAQPYPVLQIDFSDIRGGMVAARRFKPAEYIPGTLSTGIPQAILAPDTAIDVTLEIQDPGTEAMTYEFNFL